MKTVLSSSGLTSIIQTLANKILEKSPDLSNTIFAGIQQGGVVIADQLIEFIEKKDPGFKIQYGQLDITFYRDDIRKNIITPDVMNLPFGIEDKTVILIDDVLFTGRTIKAALDALLDYGRPGKVELCVLIDRKEHRQFPIQADYVGMEVATSKTDKVKLLNGEVVLLPGG